MGKRVVTLVGAAIAASAMLSVFQAASATPVPSVAGIRVPVPIVDSGRAFGNVVQQGDFEIYVGAYEGSGGLCAVISDMRGEEHRGCAEGADVEVSDTLDSAWGRGTNEWSTSVEAKGRSKTPTYKHGTLTIDVTWTGTGETRTNLDPELNTALDCWVPDWDGGGGCGNGVDFWQSRTATWSGTITDSEWGTFVVNGASGSLFQSTF